MIKLYTHHPGCYSGMLLILILNVKSIEHYCLYGEEAQIEGASGTEVLRFSGSS